MMIRAAFVVVVLGLITHVSAAENEKQTRFKQDVDSCRSIYPVTHETLDNLNQKGVLPDENDQDARCFVDCMMTKIELVDSEGLFSASHAKQYILQRSSILIDRSSSQREVDAAVDQCATASAEGKCRTNYNIWTCLYKKLHQHKASS